MEYPTTDPTLTAFHEPKTDAECVYFSAYYTETGELRMTRVVRPVVENPATLRVDAITKPEKDSERHAA